MYSGTSIPRTPLYNEVLGITNDILQPGQSYSKMCGTEPRYNEPRYNEILVITHIIENPKRKIFPDMTKTHILETHILSSMNWPASSMWVFVARLGERCGADAEAAGSNPVEAPKNFFSGYFRNCLNCDSLRWSHTHFHLYSRSSHHFIQCFIPFTG